jgi:hypothetical protein
VKAAEAEEKLEKKETEEEKAKKIPPVLRYPGYLPGYKTWPSMGLSPYAPPTPRALGGITPSFGAPIDPGQWRFDFHGSLGGGIGIGLGRRVRGGSGLGFHIPPRSSGGPQRQDVGGHLSFDYGNAYVGAHVSWGGNLTGKIWDGQYDPLSNTGLGDANVTFTLPEFRDIKAYLTVGAVSDYQGYWGFWSAMGGESGIGESLYAEWALTRDYEWVLDFGQSFMNVPKAPQNFPRSAFAGWGERDLTTTLHTYHIGLNWNNVIWGKVYFASGFAADERTVDSYGTRRQIFAPGDRQPDGRLDLYAADLHLDTSYDGSFIVQGAIVHTETAWPVHDGFWLAIDWTQGATWVLWNKIGSANGTGTVAALNAEYNFDINRMINRENYDSEQSSVWAQVAGWYDWTTQTTFEDYKDRATWWVGSAVYYSMLRWLFLWEWSMYYDWNIRTPHDEWAWVGGGLSFTCDWDCYGSVNVGYGHLFLPGNQENPNSPEDLDVITLGAEMQW